MLPAERVLVFPHEELRDVIDSIYKEENEEFDTLIDSIIPGARSGGSNRRIVFNHYLGEDGDRKYSKTELEFVLSEAFKDAIQHDDSITIQYYSAVMLSDNNLKKLHQALNKIDLSMIRIKISYLRNTDLNRVRTNIKLMYGDEIIIDKLSAINHKIQRKSIDNIHECYCDKINVVTDMEYEIEDLIHQLITEHDLD